MSETMIVRSALAKAATLAVVVAGVLTSCGSGSASDAVTTTTAASASDGAGGSTATSTTAAPATGDPATTEVATSVPALAEASEGQRSAPGDGTGIALLTSVRLGRHPGYERIVFEFAGTSTPGYRVQWTDGPITADGSGEPVEVAGEAYLEIVLEPASGVDLSAPELSVTYTGPDRIATDGVTELITDLVRTGDFEAVLSWAAGARERAPFRVVTLSSPTRVVVDLATT